MSSKYLLIITISVVFLSCKKMDSTYKQFIVPGGIRYTGKASSPVTYSGHNRIKIAWLRGADPNVTKAGIFWDNFQDSIKFDVPSSGDTISVLLENMPENKYSFFIKTYDEKGIPSVPVEIIGAVYGQQYQSQLLSRPVVSQVIDAKGKVTINWGSADISNGAYFTEVKYTQADGSQKVVRYPVNQGTSSFSGMKPGTNFQFRTVYRPDSLSLDNFFTDYADAGNFTFDKAEWKIAAFSDNQDSGNDNTVKNFIDGREDTRWHGLVGSAYPHFAVIDMGVERTITRFGVWRTTAYGGGDPRGPNNVQFLTSNDMTNWKSLGIFDFNKFINGEQTFAVPNGSPARYFKFVGLSGPEGYMVIGEISAYGF